MAIICPHCKKSFEANDIEYTALLAQIKTAEFEAEVRRRLDEISEMHREREKNRELEAQKAMESALAARDRNISTLTREIERLRGRLGSSDAERKADMASADAERIRQLGELAAKKDKEIAGLQSRLDNLETAHRLDLTNARNSGLEELHRRDRAITELTSRLEAQRLASEKQELELREQHKLMLKAKDEEIERYRDMKSRLSTKMLGETLEQHCYNVFNIARSQGGFRSAYFEKDNDASSGSKGDFIFRDYIDGEECLSIMFEMKNEADLTATKHRNEDFFAKLDRDRREKGCEYAVLVSTLEADNELYNEGIVDVSYRFEKMYVVRPQFFMPVISLLSQSSRRTAATVVALRRELSVARAQSIDVTRFEERRDKFAGEFMKFVDAHRKKHDEAIASIDRAIEDAEKQIDRLRKIKALFDTSTQKLVRAGEVIENDFTIKKLTHGNPTMRAKFADARKASQLPPEPEA